MTFWPATAPPTSPGDNPAANTTVLATISV
jgi:hypothetical protein